MRFFPWTTLVSGGSPVISGTAFPGETLTSTIAGQWYVNGNDVSGETGATYVIGLDDIGYGINQTGSNTLTCWSPADIAAVAGFWTPYRNVLNSGYTDATNGQQVYRWTDIINGIEWNGDTTKPTYNTAGTYPFVSFATTSGMQLSDLSIFNSKSYGEMFFGGKITANGSSSVYCSPIHFANGSFTLYPRLAMLTKSGASAGCYTRANRQDTSTVVTTASHSSVIGVDVVINSRAEWFTGGLLYSNVDNGTPVTTALGVTAASPATNSLTASLGKPSGLSNTQANGEYRCICLVNAALTATERSQISRYIGLFMSKNIPLV